MTPEKIYTAIQLGQSALDEKHGAMTLLWRRFGEAVREHRRKSKIPLKEFASKMAISRGMVSFLETGKREWSMERAQLAVEILRK